MSTSRASAAYSPSPSERRRFAALRRRLTPDASKHRAYLRDVSAYVAGSRVAAPRLAHDGRVGRVTALELWHSTLFGRRYLVAYVEPSWYRAVAPGSDAMTSTLSGMDALPPLVIAPHRRRRRNEQCRAIMEHEFVHINQAILGTLQPPPGGTTQQRLANVFFTRLRNEYEAHLLQTTRWPRFFPHGGRISLEHWCVLRGYTDALEAVFVAAWRGECRRRDLSMFLDRLPGTLRRCLSKLGVDAALVAWFRRHLVLHVAVAILSLAGTRPSFGRSAVFRVAHGWVGSVAALRAARYPRTRGAAVPGMAIVSRSAAHVSRSQIAARRTFLANHVRDLASIDVSTLPTARLRVALTGPASTRYVSVAHQRAGSAASLDPAASRRRTRAWL
jgi:hypothetical protein